MATKKSAAASRVKSVATSTPDEAWGEVVSRLSDLNDAVTEWTKVAAHEADARKQLDMVRTDLDEIAKKADVAAGRVESQISDQVKKGAAQAGQAFGEAAHRLREATQPHVKDAFAELADVFGKAAAKMGEPQPDSPKSAAAPAKRKAPSKKG